MGIINKTEALNLSTGVSQPVSATIVTNGQVITDVQKLNSLILSKDIQRGNKTLSEVRAELRNIAIVLNEIIGSVEKTKSFMISLQQHSLKNVFDFRELSEYAAALLSLGVDIENVIPILNGLSNIASNSSTPLTNLVTLYSKVHKEGGLVMKEMDQWGKATEPLFQSLQNTFGNVGLINMIEKGKIELDEFIDALNNLGDSAKGGNLRNSLSSQYVNLQDEDHSRFIFRGLEDAEVTPQFAGQGLLDELVELVGKLMEKSSGGENSVKQVEDKLKGVLQFQGSLKGQKNEKLEFSIKVDTTQAENDLQVILSKYKDYEEQRLAIEKKYDDDIAKLKEVREKGNAENIDRAIAKAEKDKAKELVKLSFEDLKSSDLWDSMFFNLNKMGVGAIQKLLKEAQEVNKETWSKQQIKEFEDAVQKLEANIKSRNPFLALKNDWKKLLNASNSENNSVAAGEAVQGIAGAYSEFNKLAGGVVSMLGKESDYTASQVLELTSAIGSFAEGAGKIMAGDIVGGVTSVISSVGKLFSMGKKNKEQNEATRKEMQEFYDNAIKGEKEYQALLRERQRLETEMSKIAIQRNQELTTNLSKQKEEVNKEYDQLWKELQQENFVAKVDYTMVHGLEKPKLIRLMKDWPVKPMKI